MPLTCSGHWSPRNSGSGPRGTRSQGHRIRRGEPESPAWLADVDNDEQFLTELQIRVDEWRPEDVVVNRPAEGWESFGAGGFWDRVHEAADRIVGLPGLIGSSLVVKATREKLHATVAVFVGDIFVYLNTRDGEDDEAGEDRKPGPIPSVVIKALEVARAAVTDEDPYLVVVGHSMGANILYDILTHYDAVKVDALVTVGSQVGLFEELKLFKNSDPGIPSREQARVLRPKNVAHWINVLTGATFSALPAARSSRTSITTSTQRARDYSAPTRATLTSRLFIAGSMSALLSLSSHDHLSLTPMHPGPVRTPW